MTLADLADDGVTTGQVMSRIGSSLGLCAAGEEMTALQALERFDPERLPTGPWVFE